MIWQKKWCKKRFLLVQMWLSRIIRHFSKNSREYLKIIGRIDLSLKVRLDFYDSQNDSSWFSDQSFFIMEFNVGKSRVRHTTTLSLNNEFLDRLKSLSFPPLSDIDLKNIMTLVWTTLKTSTWNEYVFALISHPTYVISICPRAKWYVLIGFKFFKSTNLP